MGAALCEASGQEGIFHSALPVTTGRQLLQYCVIRGGYKLQPTVQSLRKIWQVPVHFIKQKFAFDKLTDDSKESQPDCDDIVGWMWAGSTCRGTLDIPAVTRHTAAARHKPRHIWAAGGDRESNDSCIHSNGSQRLTTFYTVFLNNALCTVRDFHSRIQASRFTIHNDTFQSKL